MSTSHANSKQRVTGKDRANDEIQPRAQAMEGAGFVFGAAFVMCGLSMGRVGLSPRRAAGRGRLGVFLRLFQDRIDVVEGAVDRGDDRLVSD